MNDFRNYKKFIEKEDALPFEELLRHNQIEYKLIETKPAVDITFTGNSKIEYWLQLSSEDFERFDELVNQEMSHEEVEEDHYFHDFTDEELKEVVLKFEEWSNVDYHKAIKLLKERGIDISDQALSDFKTERILKLSEPEVAKKGWIIAGYIFAVLGGFIAIIIGASISSSKKTLPNGKKVYSFDRSSRKNAQIILVLGIITVLLTLILRITRVI